MLTRVNTPEEQPGEDLAELVKMIKDTYHVSYSEIGRRIDVKPATVSAWANRTRGTNRGPDKDKLRALADAFPKFTEDRIFAAAGRKTPGPLSPEATQRLLALFEELTDEQQRMQELQIRAIVEDNRSGA